MIKNVNMATMPLGPRHAWVVFVASLGQLIGTGVATLAGVVIPMLNIVCNPKLSSAMQGIIGAMDLIGIAIGSVVFGKLIDKFGYILFFRLCPALVLVGSVVSALVPSVPILIICLFLIGFGIGGEYSLDSNYVSELMPVKWKSFMVGLTKTVSAFGNIIVAGVCYLLINKRRNASEWPDLMWIVTVISGVMLVTRIWFYQSPKWLEEKGKIGEAQEMLHKFLGSDVELAPEEKPQAVAENDDGKTEGNFFSKNWKKIILTGIPWACEGLGVYGIGVFLPVLVMSLGLEHVVPNELPIVHVSNSVEITFFISCIILPGFVLGLYLIHRKINVCNMQSWGFVLCAISLAILLLASLYHWASWISILAFMAFELFLNMGPHLVTYVLPPKVYPVATRGFGTGIAASLGKVGAVLGVFFIPVLMQWGGTKLVLIVSIIVMALGAVVTWGFRKQAGGNTSSEITNVISNN